MEETREGYEERVESRTNQVKRGLVFAVLLGIGAALFSSTIVSLLNVSSNRELYSHIPLIPVVSLYFFYLGRKRIFSEVKWDFVKGLAVMLGAFSVYWLGRPVEGQLNQNDYSSLMMAGSFVWILGTFVFSYGNSASRKGAFPLLFLVFIIPIPTPILDPFVRFLQHGSAGFTHAIIEVTGVPVHRDGFVLLLPGLTIEVAQQCSGIRSSIALFITSIVAGKLFLEKGWARLVLVLITFPISIFKNALRIVTLSLLGAYVDPRFITGSWLHSSGGIPFFGVAVLLLLPVLWAIRRLERRDHSSKLIPGGCKVKNTFSSEPLIVKGGTTEMGRQGGRHA